MKPVTRKIFCARLIPLAVFVAMFALSTLVLSIHHRIESERTAAETTLAVTNFAARLETHLAARLSAGRLLGLRFVRNQDLNPEAFRKETAFLHELYRDFQALNWVDADGYIRIVTPERGNQAALGLNLRQLEFPGEALRRADQTGEMQVTPPLTLAQGGAGFVAYVPVSSGASRTGYINIVFLAEPLLSSALGPDINAAYDIQVTDDGNLLFASGETTFEEGEYVRQSVDVAGRNWDLMLRPKAATGAMPIDMIDTAILGAGFVVAVFVAYLSHLVIARQMALLDSRARQRDFASASSDWYWEMDKDLRLTWCSDGAERFFGVPVTDMVGKSRAEIREPVDGDEAWIAHLTDLAARRPFRDFSYSTLIHGERRWLRVSGVPIFDSEGTFQGYRGAASDITELVTSRSQATKANERLASAVEELNEMFSLWDEDDRLVFGNRVFRDLNREIPHVTVPGTRFEDYLRAGLERGDMTGIDGPPEDFISFSLERRYSNASEQFEVERADGKVLLLHEQKLAEGGFVTIALDITRQRESDAALRASEKRLALASQQLCIWDWNLVTDELFMSPGFAERLGYSTEEFAAIQANSVSSIIHPDDVDRYQAALHRHLVDPSSKLTSEHRFRTKSGDYRWFLAIGQAEVDAQGKPVRSTGVLTDIEDRVQLANELRQAQKMEAIGNLTGGVAHDFNNLLTVIMGNLELIREFSEDQAVRDLVEAGIGATQRGADLVRNMLGFARKSRLQPVVTDMNEILEKTATWVSRTLPETIVIDVEAQADLWETKIDPALTENVLLNLMLNARDAMPQGGKLTVETRNIRLTRADLGPDERDLEPGRYVRLSVRDTGHGILTSDLSKIFEPFFTTKPPGAGSGLGLSLVHGFMKQSGGAVHVASTPGEGALFELYFPAARSTGRHPALNISTGTAPVQAAGRIFLVEDEAEVLDVLTRILTGAGYQVTSAASGDEALTMWEGGCHFDLLITDIVMPGQVQGIQLASLLNEARPDLPVIFLSGYARESITASTAARAEDVCLMKPIPKSDLIHAVARAMHGPVAIVAE